MSILKEEEGKKIDSSYRSEIKGFFFFFFFLLEPCAGGAEYGRASGAGDVISRDLDPEDGNEGSDGVLTGQMIFVNSILPPEF